MDTLIMDRRIVWNCCSLAQIDQAKTEIMRLKREGYEIRKADGTIMERFHPNLEEVVIKAQKIVRKSIMKILTPNGDDRLTWDKNNGRQAKEAKVKFEELLSKGYKAYSVDDKGNKKRRIQEFDIDAEEILMVPKTVKG